MKPLFHWAFVCIAWRSWMSIVVKNVSLELGSPPSKFYVHYLTAVPYISLGWQVTIICHLLFNPHCPCSIVQEKLLGKTCAFFVYPLGILAQIQGVQKHSGFFQLLMKCACNWIKLLSFCTSQERCLFSCLTHRINFPLGHPGGRVTFEVCWAPGFFSLHHNYQNTCAEVCLAHLLKKNLRHNRPPNVFFPKKGGKDGIYLFNF